MRSDHPLAAMAIYVLRDDHAIDSVDLARETAVRALEACPGFLGAHTFRALNDERQFVDYVLWENAGALADAAGEAGGRGPSLVPANAMKAILFSGLFELDRCPDPVTFSGAGILQLSLIRIREALVDFAAEARQELLGAIDRDIDRCLALHSGRLVSDPVICLDALKWRSLEDQEAGGQEIHGMDACPAFMQAIEKDIYFQSVRKYA